MVRMGSKLRLLGRPRDRPLTGLPLKTARPQRLQDHTNGGGGHHTYTIQPRVSPVRGGMASMGAGPAGDASSPMSLPASSVTHTPTPPHQQQLQQQHDGSMQRRNSGSAVSVRKSLQDMIEMASKTSPPAGGGVVATATSGGGARPLSRGSTPLQGLGPGLAQAPPTGRQGPHNPAAPLSSSILQTLGMQPPGDSASALPLQRAQSGGLGGPAGGRPVSQGGSMASFASGSDKSPLELLRDELLGDPLAPAEPQQQAQDPPAAAWASAAAQQQQQQPRQQPPHHHQLWSPSSSLATSVAGPAAPALAPYPAAEAGRQGAGAREGGKSPLGDGGGTAGREGSRRLGVAPSGASGAAAVHSPLLSHEHGQPDAGGGWAGAPRVWGVGAL
jgi:hypothetical protein